MMRCRCCVCLFLFSFVWDLLWKSYSKCRTSSSLLYENRRLKIIIFSFSQDLLDSAVIGFTSFLVNGLCTVVEYGRDNACQAAHFWKWLLLVVPAVLKICIDIVQYGTIIIVLHWSLRQRQERIIISMASSQNCGSMGSNLARSFQDWKDGVFNRAIKPVGWRMVLHCSVCRCPATVNTHCERSPWWTTVASAKSIEVLR